MGRATIVRGALASLVVVAIALGCGVDVTGVAPVAHDNDAGGTSGALARDSGDYGGKGTSSSTSSTGGIVDSGRDTGTSNCPAVCSSCTATTCVKDCRTTDCSVAIFNCPAGRDCQILCDGDSRCENAVFTCANHQHCSLSCSGKQTCTNTIVNASGADQLCVKCTGAGPGVANEACHNILCSGSASGTYCKNTGTEDTCGGAQCRDELQCPP